MSGKFPPRLADKLMAIIQHNRQAVSEMTYGQVTFRIVNGQVARVSAAMTLRATPGQVSALPRIEFDLRDA